MDRREDGQPEFGGTYVISEQPAFSIPFESSDYHETLRWLLTTKRFLVVKIPIGNGSKNATLMVLYAHPRRGKEANARNEHIFDTVVGPAAGLGDTPLMICGDLQHEPRRQSRRLDFALSQGWLTDLGQTHKPVGAAQPLHTYEQGDTKTRLDFALVNEALRAAVGDFEVVQRAQRAQDHPDLGHPRTEGVDDETTHDSECGRPATFGTHLSEKMETGEPRVRNQRRRKSEAMSKAWRVITDAFVQSMLIQTAQKPKYM